MKAARAAKKNNEEIPKEEDVTQIAPEQNQNDILRQLKELQESNALLKAAILNNQTIASGGVTTGVSMNRNGELIGEFEKYQLDPALYPDPTPRLSKEPRLAPLAFEYNYEMDYQVTVSEYQTASGRRVREPKFHVTLNRVVLDDQGNQTSKRYIARKLIFHEDPDAALVIAREQNIDIDKSDEKTFLNEMRYLRVRDWLFDIFWPKPIDESSQIREEVIGGTLVQVFEKKSLDSSNIEFDKLKSKIV